MNEIENLKNVYLKRKYDNPNAIYYFIREIQDNNLMFKMVDTITLEEEYVVLPKTIVISNYYTAYEFIKDAKFIGKSGYFKTIPFHVDRTIYKSYILLYKDDYYELVYDTFDETMKILPSICDMKDFVEVYNPGADNIDIKPVQLKR